MSHKNNQPQPPPKHKDPFPLKKEKKTVNPRISSSSCSIINTDIPDPFSPPFSIAHCFRQVLRTTSRIGTELLYVGSGRPAFARPCEGAHRSTSLMSSSLLLQQCPACLVRLTWIVFVVGGR